MILLRKLVWLYLILLIVEGALRKWIVPQLDQPLLIVRDPLVLWIYYEAYKNRLSFSNGFLLPNIALGVLAVIISTLFGVGSIPITVYGVRTDFLQIPLIFLIPQIVDRDDVVRMGHLILYVSIPMAGLAVLQFLTPPDGLLNKGAFATHFGTVRPSGTFSYISGLSFYFALTSAFLFYGYLQARTYKIWLLLIVTFAILIAAGCSGSRTCLASIGMVTAAAILCVITRGKGGMGMLVAAALIGMAFLVLSSTSVFKKGTEQMQARMVESSEYESDQGGFLGRFFGTMFKPITALDRFPLFGFGLGLGTNAGASMAHNPDLYWPEEEWDRLTFECGPVLGVALCIFRTCLTIHVFRRVFAAFRRDNILPILLFPSCGLLLLNGQWGVPTTLGFAIFGAGLMLAACVIPPEYDEEETEEEDEHFEDEPERLPAAGHGRGNVSR